MKASKQQVREIAGRLSGHFRSLGDFWSKWFAHYTRIKVRTDPAYEAIWEELEGGDGDVLDIGCGLGLLSFYLRERGYSGGLLGIDYDAKKISAAKVVSENYYGGVVGFSTGDARESLPEFTGSVTILDILQYFDAGQQEALLRSVASKVANGGKLLIRGGLRSPGWRFRATQAGDLFSKITFWTAAPVHYPTAESIRVVLEDCGLSGEIRPLWGRTPFNNYLAVFSRKSKG